jgi:hypothetical protein
VKNPKLSEWLQIVWDALAESDEAKRTSMLHAADRLLQEGDNERPRVLLGQPCVIQVEERASI